MLSLSAIPDVTFAGPRLDRAVSDLPRPLASVLLATNGVVALRGGIHVRGVVSSPDWHSLDAARHSSFGISAMFARVDDHDIPFAQDCLGDQFLLRDRQVYRLSSETGEVSPFASDLSSWLRGVIEDGWQYLNLAPLLQFEREGGSLKPGQLLNADPPFCTKESQNGVALRAIPAAERIGFLADFSRSIADIPDGGQARVITHES